MLATLGDRIKMHRKEMRLSQKAFATMIGTSQGYICDIEKGKKSPGSDFLKSLKHIMNIDLNWYLTGTTVDPETASPVALKIGKLMEGMDDDFQQDVLKYATDKKLLSDLLREKKRLSP